MNLISFLEYLTWCQKKQFVYIAQYKFVIWSSYYIVHQEYSRFCVMFQVGSESFILQWTYVYWSNNTAYNISQNYYPGINYQQNIVLFCTLKYLRRMKIFYFPYCLKVCKTYFPTLILWNTVSITNILPAIMLITNHYFSEIRLRIISCKIDCRRGTIAAAFIFTLFRLQFSASSSI